MTFERTYVIPLRAGTHRAPQVKRAKKAVAVLKTFVAKHAKSQDIVVGTELNQMLWGRGIRNPPTKVTVTVMKDKDNKVFVNLVGVAVKKEAPKEEPKKKAPAKKADAKKADSAKAE